MNKNTNTKPKQNLEKQGSVGWDIDTLGKIRRPYGTSDSITSWRSKGLCVKWGGSALIKVMRLG